MVTQSNVMGKGTVDPIGICFGFGLVHVVVVMVEPYRISTSQT